MNIILVSREFPPFYGGGIGTYTEQAAHALAGAGHRVVVLTVSRDGTSSRAPHGRDPRITVVRVPLVAGDDWSRPAAAIDTPENRAAFTQLGPWSVFSRQVADTLPLLVREFSTDVVEAPECGAILWWTLNDRRIGRGALRRSDGSEPLLVVQLHSPNEWVDEHNRQAPPVRASLELRRAERESAQWADLVISPSRDLGAWAQTRWGLRAVETVPYPLGFIQPEPREGVRAGDSPLRCLLVGRLEPRKGVDVLIAAMAIAGRRGLDVRVELAGQDTRDWRTGAWFTKRAINTMLAPSHADRVTLLGKIDAPALAAARARADICLAPGIVDNFPYAAVESMAAGLPVIAPSVGGMSELVRDGVEGHIFRPHDPASLAEAILAHAACPTPTRVAMAQAAVDRVTAFCSNQRAVSIRESLFARALSDRTSGQAFRLPEADVIVIAGEAPSLVGAVRSGAGDFAIGWERAPDASVIAHAVPGRVASCIGMPVRGPVAVRAELLDALLAEQGEFQDGGPDPDTLVRCLIDRAARGAVDPNLISPQASRSAGLAGIDDGSPHGLEPATFREVAPLRMARRLHPYPWEVVPVEKAATPAP